MRFEKHYSLLHSEKVLKLVRKNLKGSDVNVTIRAWSNGREQGFNLSRNEPRPSGDLVFAQQRNSDAVLIVMGPSEEFDIQTHQPSEKLWETPGARLVIYDDDMAARAIADFLLYYPLRDLANPRKNPPEKRTD